MTPFEKLRKAHLSVLKSMPGVTILAEYTTSRYGVKDIVGNARLFAFDEYEKGHASAWYQADGISFNVRYLGDKAHVVKYKLPG